MTTSGWRGCLPFTLCHLGNDGSDLGDDVDGFEAQAAGAAGQELGTNGRLHLAGMYRRRDAFPSGRCQEREKRRTRHRVATNERSLT